MQVTLMINGEEASRVASRGCSSCTSSATSWA